MPNPRRRQATWPPCVSVPPSVALPRPPTDARSLLHPRSVPCRSHIATKQPGHQMVGTHSGPDVQEPHVNGDFDSILHPWDLRNFTL